MVLLGVGCCVSTSPLGTTGSGSSNGSTGTMVVATDAKFGRLARLIRVPSIEDCLPTSDVRRHVSDILLVTAVSVCKKNQNTFPGIMIQTLPEVTQTLGIKTGIEPAE
nr:unnamed protein product [Callosobruchus analis]